MVVWALLCEICVFPCQEKVLKTFPGPGYIRSEEGVIWLWHSLIDLYIWLTISSSYGSILLISALIGRYGGLSSLVSDLLACLWTEGAYHVSWPWLSPLRGWGSLTMAFTIAGKHWHYHWHLLSLVSTLLHYSDRGIIKKQQFYCDTLYRLATLLLTLNSFFPLADFCSLKTLHVHLEKVNTTYLSPWKYHTTYWSMLRVRSWQLSWNQQKYLYRDVLESSYPCL